MRDFRDAKAMARTLRAALAAKGLKITVSESLELIAQAFGEADWNTLAATIRLAESAPRKGASPPPPPTAETILGPGHELDRTCELTLHRALDHANQREHDYVTLEHLLLGLIDDVDASTVMKACNVDLGALKKNVVSYVDNELAGLANAAGEDSRPTSGFQRVVQRAARYAQPHAVTGAHLLVAIFDERESHAAWFLGEQGVTYEDAKTFAEQGVVRQSFGHGRKKPLVVEKIKRRPRMGKR
jgi:Glyoxalase superfamily protein/Clp amino terminal domain, pathogenicity island component